MHTVIETNAFIAGAAEAGMGDEAEDAMKSAFEKIAAGLEDAIAYVDGDRTRGREAKPIDVRSIRRASRLSQDHFAKRFRLPVGSVRDWEQRRRQPDTGTRLYLQMIEADAEGVERIIAKVA